MFTILIIVLLILLLGSFPGYSYNSGWGYGPFGALLIIALLIFIFRGSLGI